MISRKLLPLEKRLTRQEAELIDTITLRNSITESGIEILIDSIKAKDITLIKYHKALTALEEELLKYNPTYQRYRRILQYIFNLEKESGNEGSFDMEEIVLLKKLNNLLELIDKKMELAVKASDKMLMKTVSDQAELISRLLNTDTQLMNSQDIIALVLTNYVTIEEVIKAINVKDEERLEKFKLDAE